jgi:uncharacterized membrane-anchored protein
MWRPFLRVSILCLAFCTPAWAENPETGGEPSSEQTMTADQFEASLHYKTGSIVIGDGLATLKISERFRYLDPADTEKVIVQAWGNPAGDGTLGMILPADVSPVRQNGWGVVISYEEDGYVSDADADSIKYDDLLRQMQESVREGNKERTKAGYPPLELVGWAEPPRYDKASHKLYWAKELKFGDSPTNTLNYNIRILGRRGVLVLNAVAGVDQLGAVKNDMQDILALTDFNPGHTYAEFDPGSDKTAAYGLAALVAGGIAAKTGLFAKLLALAIAGKKALIAGAVVLFGLLGRLFKR